jgi:hypothetical protein
MAETQHFTSLHIAQCVEKGFPSKIENRDSEF